MSWMSSWVTECGCSGPLTVAVQQGATEQQARRETRRRRHQATGGTPQHSGRRNPSPRWCPLEAGSGVITTRQGNLPRLKLWLKCLRASGIALVELERIYLRLRHFLHWTAETLPFLYKCVNYTLRFILTKSLWLLFISELKSSCERLAHLVSLTIHLHWHCT